MPASEETYRSQPTLHLVFAISSIAMLLVTVWMVMADHLRPWKQVQREFQVRRARQAQGRREGEARRAEDQVQGPDRQASTPRSQTPTPNAAEHAGKLRKLEHELSTLDGTKERLDTERRFQKADLDSKRSLYDGMIDRGEET